MVKKGIIIGIIGIIFVTVIAFYLLTNNDTEEIRSIPSEISEGSNKQLTEGNKWINTDLKDVRTGNNFKISDFKNKPVFLESFAVWCPTCTKQQRIIKELHEEVGNSIVSISLNTDANEDEEKVREHVTRNGFDWYYSISPIEFTQELIDEFGPGIVSAPSVPMVLICPDGLITKLKNGVKSKDELKSLASNC